MYDEMVLQDGAALYWPSSAFPSSLSASDGVWSADLNCSVSIDEEEVLVSPTVGGQAWTVRSNALDQTLLSDECVHVGIRAFSSIDATLSIELWDASSTLVDSVSVTLQPQVIKEQDFLLFRSSHPSFTEPVIRISSSDDVGTLTFDYIRVLGSQDNSIKSIKPVYPSEIVNNKVVVNGRTPNDYITIDATSNVLAAKRNGAPLHKHSGSSVILVDNAQPVVVDTDIDFINAQGTIEFWLKTGTTIYPEKLLGRGNDGLYISNSALLAVYRDKVASYDIQHIDMAVLIHMIYSANELRVLVNGETIMALSSDEYPDQPWVNDFVIKSVRSHVPTQISSIAIYPYAMSSDIAKKHYIVGHGSGDLSAFIKEYGGSSYTPNIASLASNNYFSIKKNRRWTSGSYDETLQASNNLSFKKFKIPDKFSIVQVGSPPESSLSWAFISDAPVTLKRSDILAYIQSISLALSRTASMPASQDVLSIVYENNYLNFIVDANSITCKFNGTELFQVANSELDITLNLDLLKILESASSNLDIDAAQLRQTIEYGNYVLTSVDTDGVAISALGLSNGSIIDSSVEILNQKEMPETQYVLKVNSLGVQFLDIALRGTWTFKIPFSYLLGGSKLDYLQFSTSRAITNRSLRLPYNVLTSLFPTYQIDQLEDFVTTNGTQSVSYDEFVDVVLQNDIQVQTASNISYSVGVENEGAEISYDSPADYYDTIYPVIDDPNGYYFDNGSILALSDSVVTDRLFLRINVDIFSNGLILSPVMLSDIVINVETNNGRKPNVLTTHEGSTLMPTNSVFNFGIHQNVKRSKVFVRHPLYRLPSFCKSQYSGLEIINPEYTANTQTVFHKNVLYTKLSDDNIESISFWIRPNEQLPNVNNVPLISLLALNKIFGHIFCKRTDTQGQWSLEISDKDGWQSYTGIDNVQFMIDGNLTNAPRLNENRWSFVTVLFPTTVKPDSVSQMALQIYGGFSIDELYIHRPVSSRFISQQYQRVWLQIKQYEWLTVKTDLATWQNVRYGTVQIETKVPFNIHERILGVQKPVVFTDTSIPLVDEQYYVTTGIKW